MRVYKYFIDLDKEERWLQEMAAKGYLLEAKTSFGYRFRPTKQVDCIIKVDYRTFKRKDDFIDYITLFEDSGWQHISGTKNSGTQYFKKIDHTGDDEIFSDKISQAGKYQRLSKMFLELTIVYLPLMVALIYTGAIDLDALFNPKLLYLTPGLWEMSGAAFWRSFLFETPFVVFRNLMGLFIPIAMTLFLFFSYKAQKLYNKKVSQ